MSECHSSVGHGLCVRASGFSQKFCLGTCGRNAVFEVKRFGSAGLCFSHQDLIDCREGDFFLLALQGSSGHGLNLQDADGDTVLTILESSAGGFHFDLKVTCRSYDQRSGARQCLGCVIISGGLIGEVKNIAGSSASVINSNHILQNQVHRGCG